MKKWISAAMSLLILLYCAACGGENQTDTESGTLIYFLAPDSEVKGGDRITGSYEELDVPPDAPVETQAQAVVERLLSGPADGEMDSPLPEGVELLSVEVRDRRAYVDLSSEFNLLGGVELSMADYCLTLSLTALEGIAAVSITAQGREVGQQPEQVFYERDVLLSTMDDVLQTAEVVLYFLDEENALTGEKRTVELYEGQTLAENLIAALLAGPENKNLHRALPDNFAVNSVRVEDGVCVLNLTAASLALLPEDSNAQRWALWSLADSLYSIDSVRELRILADGEELQSFGSLPVDTVAVRPKG